MGFSYNKCQHIRTPITDEEIMTDMIINNEYSKSSSPYYVNKNELYTNFFEIYKQWMNDLITRYRVNSIFDIGCGGDWISSWMPNNIDYIGVDIVKNVIEELRIKHENRKYIHGNVLDIDIYSSRKFDFM